MQPFLLLAGTADEAFVADQFESLVSEYTSVQVELMPDLSHMGVVVSPDVQPLLEDWLGGL
jgi:hypothetical protein